MKNTNVSHSPLMSQVGLFLLSMVIMGSSSSKANGQTTVTGQNSPARSIGIATMNSDGTIILRLRAESPDGTIGHAHLTLRRSNPRYKHILSRVGGLKPGESKSIPAAN